MYIAIDSFVIVVHVITDFLGWYNCDAACFSVSYQKTNIAIEKPYQTWYNKFVQYCVQTCTILGKSVQYCGKSDLVSGNICLTASSYGTHHR